MTMSNQQQTKLSRLNSRQSSIGETNSVCSTKSDARSNGSADCANNNNNNNNNINNNNPLNHKKQSNGLNKHQLDDNNDAKATSILNVAEMLLHGVADNEILDIWLKSIQCDEFVSKFIDAGYDMPTISRITPQDLTAIGVTEPAKRLKILTEIKKLNLQDGIPNFKPASLNNWLSLIRLDSYYYKSLCDQQIDTIDKLCQLTWEDFEELGITKLGHQKRFQLAIERVKEIEADLKCSSKAISEPIYDTNPSQILLVASAENHSMNGPIINKQSSTSEISSTGSGSMHSVYSAASTHYQPTYAPLPADNNQLLSTNNQQNHQTQQPSLKQQQQSQQQIYSQQPPPPLIYQQPTQLTSSLQQQQQPKQQSHYQHQPMMQQQQPSQLPMQAPQFMNAPFIINEGMHTNGNGGIAPQLNRQSIGQLPFALANLPKHQQMLLQQSSIYATLSRQPSKVKQPPPPVPIRTNSLKTNSLIDETSSGNLDQKFNQHPPLNNSQATSTCSLYRSDTRVMSRNQFSTQTMLTKNKSFSGNAHMEASRARFLNRQSQQPHQYTNEQTINFNNGSGSNFSIHNHNSSFYGNQQNQINGPQPMEVSNIFRQPNHLVQQQQLHQQNLQQSSLPNSQVANNSINQRDSNRFYNSDDFDLQSDTQSTKSLIMPSSSSSSSVITSPVNTNNIHKTSGGASTHHDTGSSQTLYNSASSGSNDNSLNMLNQIGGINNHGATLSSCTLNNVSQITDQQHPQQNFKSMITNDQNGHNTYCAQQVSKNVPTNGTQCNATTGKDDDFPPPPSPLSMADVDEHDLVTMTSNINFTDVNHAGLMTFRVGI